METEFRKPLQRSVRHQEVFNALCQGLKCPLCNAMLDFGFRDTYIQCSNCMADIGLAYPALGGKAMIASVKPKMTEEEYGDEEYIRATQS